MLKQKKLKLIIHAFIVSLLVAVAIYPVFAYVMKSENYRIRSDSLNVGGVGQGSSSYLMEDTLGEIATGESASASYRLKAGYQQMEEVYISISSPEDIAMSPDIYGTSGGTGNGSTTWTVITDSQAGYTLSISASASPALATGDYSFADYAPATAGTPDYTWTVDATDSGFGFTPEGGDIVQKYRDNGIDEVCNSGTNDTPYKCWYGLSISDENIAVSSTSNHPSGTSVTVRFRAESGVSHIQPEGIYAATVIVTALTN